MSVARTKAYKAILPFTLRDDQLAGLMAWGRENCWKSKVATCSHNTIWVAMREKPQSKTAWMQHVSRVLEAHKIDTHLLKGHGWLELCTSAEANEMMQRLAQHGPGPKVSAGPAKRGHPRTPPSDEKVIELPSPNFGYRKRRRGGAITTVEAAGR